MAYNASMFVNSLSGSKFAPDFSNYYWTTNLISKYLGITKSAAPKLILINKNVYPKALSSSNELDIYSFFEFGVTLNHEWLHFYHNLNHPQVQMICDWPAEIAFKQLLIQMTNTPPNETLTFP